MRLLCVVLLGLCLLSLLRISNADCVLDCGEHGQCVGSSCVCQSPYIGLDCSVFDLLLTSGQEVTGQEVASGWWNYYHINVTNADSALFWTVSQESALADCDLYLKRGSYPNRLWYDSHNSNTDQTFSLNVTHAGVGTWYAGVYGYTDCAYSIKAVVSSNSCPNSCSNHGTCASGVCTCNSGWVGNDCSKQEIALTNNVAQTGSVTVAQWSYFSFQGQTTMDWLAIQLTNGAGEDADLFISKTTQPTLYSYDYANLTMLTTSVINLTAVTNTLYHIGVYGYSAASFSITATAHMPSSSTDCANQCSLHGTCSRGACVCTNAYTGTNCETMIRAATLGSTYSGFVGSNAWNYYHFQAFSSNNVLVQVSQVTTGNVTGDCDLYVKRGANPTRFSYDYFDISLMSTFSVSVPAPGNDVWYVGLYGWRACQYNLVISLESTCSCPAGAHGSCASGSTICNCNSGWGGPACDTQIPLLINSVAATNQHVYMNQWAYFQITTNSTFFEVAIKEAENAAGTTGNLWLYTTLTGSFPTLTTYDDADQTPGVAVHYGFVEFTTPKLYTYTIGVYGNPFIQSTTTPIQFQIVAWSPSQ